jgi:hypothetical protein
LVAAAVLKRTARAIQDSCDLGADQAHLSHRAEAIPEKNCAVDDGPIGSERDTALVVIASPWVLERATTALEVPANSGAQQTYRTIGVKAITKEDPRRNANPVCENRLYVGPIQIDLGNHSTAKI